MSRHARTMLILILMLFFALVLQDTLMPRLVICGAVAYLPVIFVIIISLMMGARQGFAWGLVSGLLLDLLAGKYIGLNMLALMTAGYFCGLLFAQLHKTNVLIHIGACAVGAVIYGVCYLIIGEIIGINIIFFHDLLTLVIPCAIYTTLLSLPIYVLVSIIRQRVNDKQLNSF